MRLTVSIAMCTYNGARFLREQLDSLAAQTYLPEELIICDDISTDETTNIITEFASRAPFSVRLIINETRLFFQRNFIKAAAACSSDLIAFCDQDDIWMPQKLATIVAEFHDKDIMVIAHQARLIDHESKEIASRIIDADFAPIYNRLSCRPWNFSRGFTQVFRQKINAFASLHQMTEGFSTQDPYISHDSWIQVIGNSLGKVLWIDTPLAYYRQHEHNLFGIKAYVREMKNFDVLSDILAASEKASIIYNIFSFAALQPKFLEFKILITDAKYHWRKVSRSFYLRYNLYTESNIFNRLRSFYLLIKIGAYDSRKRWAFSMRSILKDLFIFIFNYKNYILLREKLIVMRYLC